MIIKQNRIVKLEKYIRAFEKGDLIRVGIPKSLAKDTINEYGVNQNKNGAYLALPVSHLTNQNINGHWVTIKGLSKEPRLIEREFRIIDFQGTWHEGIARELRDCYPREFIDPKYIYIYALNGDLFTKEFEIGKDNEIIKFAVNLLLEMNEECELVKLGEDFQLNQMEIKYIDWEIFPKGDALEKNINKVIEERTKNNSDHVKDEIHRRIDKIKEMNPCTVYKGHNTFNDYMAFEFKSSNLFVLESDRLNNATYIFSDNWEELSKLTKGKLINENLYTKRLIHDENWAENIDKILS